MPDVRCARCGAHAEADLAHESPAPAREYLEALFDDQFPGGGPSLDDLCAELWLLELIVFICKQGPEASLCRTCRSPKH